MIAALEMSTPSSAALARTVFSVPRMVRSTTPRRRRVDAALRIRSSSPSGRTMCCFGERARSRSAYSNMSGVTTSVEATLKIWRSASQSTCFSKRALAVSTLSDESRVSRPRVFEQRVAASKVPRSQEMTGRLEFIPERSRRIASVGWKPPLMITPASVGNPAAPCAAWTARRASARSPGVMTTRPSRSRSRR